MRKRTRLLLVDNHPVVRKGLCSWMEKHPGFAVVGEAGNGHAALRAAGELKPDLVLMDLDLPDMDGLAATELLHKEWPEIKVIILCMRFDDSLSARVIQCGALGCILKTASREELVCAVEAVVAGKPLFSQGGARLAVDQHVGSSGEEPNRSVLTNRERDVLRQVAEGLSNKEIGARLSIAVRTVETHRERVMRKLNIHTVAGLTRFAIANELTSLPGNPEDSARAA